ncbi:MAG TPA: lytic murein transglycosylase [Solirubrobacterales bacterium]|jgi:cell wall-associated NlpC family hydrolase|nr:lytic murein transglycosylase [Solirubrobacterales bacterium]
MTRTRKILAVAAAAAATIALSLPIAATADTAATPATSLAAPQPATIAPAPVQQGTTLAPPATTAPSTPTVPQASGGVSAGEGDGETEAPEEESTPGEEGEGAIAAPDPSEALQIPSLPTSSCAATGVPPVLIPMYQRAAASYGLGPQGPAVLAGINEVETAFGTNLNISSAGAEGWMQFMPETWAGYGVDANGDGVKDPFNPEDAIFTAASYLSANGMPTDTYGAIFAYNHADWYVSEVLANAGCYAAEVGDPAFTTSDLGPQLQVLRCSPAPAWKQDIPAAYLSGFENAAARYELGKRGVWALAAIARLESNFGKGMDKKQLHDEGPLGLDPTEWRHFAVDGDGDGHIRHGDPADSAATLARLIWSRGSLAAGIFTHNQAEWYVQEVLREAEQIEGGCKVSYVDWRVAPLGTGFETPGPNAVLSGNLASAPQSAPPAVKAAIEAANSISTTPYVWGGGHGSWYSSGYDCSGAVSFALYGAGLLDTPLTSGSLMSYGEPGPGKWITIYASPTHAYAVIAGLRWDTVGDAQGTGPRWHLEPPYPEGFVVRHPTGY